MDYHERAPSPRLEGLVKASWHLAAGDDANAWVEHFATPDGSIEIVRRDRGESKWHRAQPRTFAAGLTTSPARLQMRGDAIFLAVRLWPWTWHALGGEPCHGFIDDWIALSPASRCRDIADNLEDENAVEQLILDALSASPDTAAVQTIGRAILRSSSVAEVCKRTGLSHRSLQRWSRVHIGVPMRSYLRLLRFQSALADVQGSTDTLAQSAAVSGYADQAHMARSFRELAGAPALHARSHAVGPFLKGGQTNNAD